LRLRIYGLLVTNEQGQQLETLQCSRLQSVDAANDDVAAQLDNAETKRNPSVQRGRGPDDAIRANHGGLDHVPRLERHDQRHHRSRRKVDVLDFLFCFEQDRMLRE
jgi:hypothetical protein